MTETSIKTAYEARRIQRYLQSMAVSLKYRNQDRAGMGRYEMLALSKAAQIARASIADSLAALIEATERQQAFKGESFTFVQGKGNLETLDQLDLFQ